MFNFYLNIFVIFFLSCKSKVVTWRWRLVPALKLSAGQISDTVTHVNSFILGSMEEGRGGAGGYLYWCSSASCGWAWFSTALWYRASASWFRPLCSQCWAQDTNRAADLEPTPLLKRWPYKVTGSEWELAWEGGREGGSQWEETNLCVSVCVC